MRVTVNFRNATPRDLQALERWLENPGPTLIRLGALVAGASQEAFRTQRFGDVAWPERYPGQREPKLNIAGTIMDFRSGRTSPKPNRFQDRPALQDEGMRGGLRASITFQPVSKTSFSVGTVKPYAILHQEGGHTSIPVDDATKERMRNWLYKRGGGPIRGKVKRADYRTGREGYGKHLNPVLRKDVTEWRQSVIARPFIGIHPRLEEKIMRMLKREIERLKGGP